VRASFWTFLKHGGGQVEESIVGIAIFFDSEVRHLGPPGAGEVYKSVYIVYLRTYGKEAGFGVGVRGKWKAV
jgi:hypothetical protein